jgi:hypothetical protein
LRISKKRKKKGDLMNSAEFRPGINFTRLIPSIVMATQRTPRF